MSNKKFVKKSDKKNSYVNVIITLVAVVLVCVLLITVSNGNGNKSVIKNHIQEISYSEFNDKIKSNDFTIYLLASPECSHCQEYKPLVNLVADENNLDIYYVNVISEELSEDEYISLRNSISATKDEVDSYGNPVIPTPTTVIFKNGVEVASELGNIGYDSFRELLKNNGVIK